MAATSTYTCFAARWMLQTHRKYLRHVYLLTDGCTPVQEASQLGDIVNMYTDPSMDCRCRCPPPAFKRSLARRIVIGTLSL